MESVDADNDHTGTYIDVSKSGSLSELRLPVTITDVSSTTAGGATDFYQVAFTNDSWSQANLSMVYGPSVNSAPSSSSSSGSSQSSDSVSRNTVTAAATRLSDIFFGSSGEDILFGDAGNDFLYGGEDNDTVYGGIGHDVINGNQGDDIVIGGDGNDFVMGGKGNDIVYGKSGTDYMFGGYGDDILIGGDGDDVIYFSPGRDVVEGFKIGSDSFNDNGMTGVSWTLAQDGLLATYDGGSMLFVGLQSLIVD